MAVLGTKFKALLSKAKSLAPSLASPITEHVVSLNGERFTQWRLLLNSGRLCGMEMGVWQYTQVLLFRITCSDHPQRSVLSG